MLVCTEDTAKPILRDEENPLRCRKGRRTVNGAVQRSDRWGSVRLRPDYHPGDRTWVVLRQRDDRLLLPAPAFTRSSFRKLFRLRTNSISMALSAASRSMFSRSASRIGSAHFGESELRVKSPA